MGSPKDFFNKIYDKINIDNLNERKEIVFILIEFLTGLNKTDILINKDFDFGPYTAKVEQAILRINTNEPIQYIIEEAYFFGRKFYVNSNVLIPRPETEELVNRIIETKPNRILDLGTGSGCIAISLDLELNDSEVFGVDISENALLIAEKNQLRLKSAVNFIKGNILNFESFDDNKFDVIVSNPPYVKYSESPQMSKNVLDFEPHIALFVEDNDPLLFYRKIAEIGHDLLKENGQIWVEINSELGPETLEVLKYAGYQKNELIKDINGKDRIIFAQKN